MEYIAAQMQKIVDDSGLKCTVVFMVQDEGGIGQSLIMKGMHPNDVIDVLSQCICGICGTVRTEINSQAQ